MILDEHLDGMHMVMTHVQLIKRWQIHSTNDFNRLNTISYQAYPLQSIELHMR